MNGLKDLRLKNYALLVACIFLLFCLVSCCPRLVSPDGRYKAIRVRDGESKHYQVIDTQLGHPIFTTRAQYDTPNNVKGGEFSPDSKEFAAIYHYGHEGTYTWIGVWDVEAGTFLQPVQLS